MPTEKISQSCLDEDNPMEKGDLLDKISSTLIASFTGASQLLPELGIRQSSIDSTVKEFIIDRACRFSESELVDILQNPTRLFKAFALFTENNNHRAKKHAHETMPVSLTN